MKLLLIKTTDRREFFTQLANYPILLEYANTFGSKLYTVQTDENIVPLSAEALASELCSGEGKKVQYQIVQKHLPAISKSNKRRDEQDLAKQIRNFIKEELLKGNPVSLISIRKQFSKYSLKTCTVSNHYAGVRGQLKTQGHSIKRIGHGVYQTN